MLFEKNTKENGFHIILIDSCIKSYLNKIFGYSLSFLGKLSLDLMTRLKNSVSKNLFIGKIRVIFKSLTRTSNFSSSKINYPTACALMLFTNFCVVDAMLPITAKHADI